MSEIGDRVRIVCISDTHNDDCSASLPDGDILIHAGDMTDDGTMEELQKAYDWISKLPHRIKVIVAGNHDLGLDRDHKGFLPETLSLFTSDAAKTAGIVYVDSAVRQVPAFSSTASDESSIPVYGNPRQPDFLKKKDYAFTYRPSPSDDSVAAWADAPKYPSVPIWVTHGPPLGRLDWIPIPPLKGCAVQARAVSRAKPALIVFGHYHISHGAEVVTWKKDSDEAEQVERLVEDGKPSLLDFTSNHSRFERGEKTVFVNAAWMTLNKSKPERYQPIVLDLPKQLLVGEA